MTIKKLVVGDLAENCYIITKNGKALIIDPGDEASKIIAECVDLDVIGVLVTHHHFDHIGALKKIENEYNIKENGLCDFFDYQIIRTPGHTSDSVTFYFASEKVMFTGDFLFKGTIGRTDLETGSTLDMQKSLTKISNYSDDIKIYPGHGNSSLLGIEKKRFKFYF